jgi:NAD(P)-dependent dehydrogenase (short-subunit alcohol dehydrogenase family)
VKALSGQLAIVTGASRGIGAAAATLLRDAGARVVRIARSLKAREHDDMLDVPCDLASPDAAAALFERLLSELGPPHIVVSNAGSFLLKPLDGTSQDEFDAQVAINLRAPFTVARAFLPAMREAGRGTFIHVGSVADHVGFAGNAAYSASKFGLRGLHESLAAEYRGSGVRLSLVSPGPTDTAAWDPVDPDAKPYLPNRADMMRPADVAEAVLWVASRPVGVHVDWLRLGPAL